MDTCYWKTKVSEDYSHLCASSSQRSSYQGHPVLHLGWSAPLRVSSGCAGSPSPTAPVFCHGPVQWFSPSGLSGVSPKSTVVSGACMGLLPVDRVVVLQSWLQRSMRGSPPSGSGSGSPKSAVAEHVWENHCTGPWQRTGAVLCHGGMEVPCCWTTVMRR